MRYEILNIELNFQIKNFMWFGILFRVFQSFSFNDIRHF